MFLSEMKYFFAHIAVIVLSYLILVYRVFSRKLVLDDVERRNVMWNINLPLLKKKWIWIHLFGLSNFAHILLIIDTCIYLVSLIYILF
jgi:hypothetical protein